MGSIIHAGVTIGSESVIEPGSVVIKGTKIPIGEVWGGNPAKLIRQLTDTELKSLQDQIVAQKALSMLHRAEHSKSPQTHYEFYRIRQLVPPTVVKSEPTQVANFFFFCSYSAFSFNFFQ